MSEQKELSLNNCLRMLKTHLCNNFHTSIIIKLLMYKTLLKLSLFESTDFVVEFIYQMTNVLMYMVQMAYLDPIYGGE